MVLYGSYARGTNTSESDVDVASFNIIYSKNSSSSASSTGRA
ncbi:nucleotidyltransferase domain-containing protein [Blautia massiliensis (ex Durand et al. 2017)]